jgi:hypothetical protein
MEDSLFGSKLAMHFNLKNRDFDVVDNNDNTPLIIKSSDVENMKLSRKNNYNKLNRSNLIKMLDLVTLKLSNDVRSEPIHDINDKATDKLCKSYASMSNDNGKARAITVSSMVIYSKMSLHVFGSGFTSYYSTIWRNNIEIYRSQINSNIPVINPNSPFISDTNAVGISQASIAGIVSLSINNTISIDIVNGAKPNEPSLALLPIPPTFTQLCIYGSFKKTSFSVLYRRIYIIENKTR